MEPIYGQSRSLSLRVHSKQVGTDDVSVLELVLLNVLQTKLCNFHSILFKGPHPSTKPGGVFLAGENMSDTDNLLLCGTCVKGKLQTFSRVYMRKLVLGRSQS